MDEQLKNDHKPANEAAYLSEAQERARVAADAWQVNHTKWKEDMALVSGKQWPDEIVRDREADGRVILTMNQLPKYARQVLGDGKQNRIQIKVRPIEGNRDARLRNMAGTQDYSYAEVMEGIVRNIEAVSRAERAYDMALEHCVQGGFGWLRVMKRYARPDGFEQDLIIRGVRNPFSVLYDPEAMLSDEPDFQGGMYAFVHTMVPTKTLEKQYGETFADVDFGNSSTEAQRWWYEKDQRRLAEYYYIEKKPVVYVLLSDGSVMEAEDLKDAKAQVMAKGLQIMNHRNGERQCVYWSLLHGAGIIEGPYLWDGAYIPLIPVLGPEMWLDTGVEYQSLFRHSHDAQRMYNYWRTAATEAVALAPKAPWMADAASIQGFEKDYERATREPVSLLKYRSREGVPAPSRMQMSATPAAEIQQALQANDDLKGTIGIFDASIGQRSNETSGRAILARQREADVGTFAWHDALAKAVEHVGRIVVDLIPKVYDTPRMLRVKLPDDQEDFVQINYETEVDGKLVKADLGTQRYDVAVTTGPSVTTQRLEAATSMLEFSQTVPAAAQAIMDLVAKNMDWPGSDEIAKRLKKLVPPNLLEPAELQEMQASQQQDPAQQQAAQAEQQAQQQQQALAEADLQARTVEAQAKLISAQASQITAQAKLLEAQNTQPEQIKDMVAEAIAEILPELLQAQV